MSFLTPLGRDSRARVQLDFGGGGHQWMSQIKNSEEDRSSTEYWTVPVGAALERACAWQPPVCRDGSVSGIAEIAFPGSACMRGSGEGRGREGGRPGAGKC